MRVNLFACAAIVAAMMPAAAMADDPRDPKMRSAAARSHDHETIRQLNLQQLAMVRHRDAQYAEGWRTTRATADYARSRAQYDQEMAAWRHAVAECRQGNTSACAH